MRRRLALAALLTTLAVLLASCGLLPLGGLPGPQAGDAEAPADLFPAMGRAQRVSESGGEYAADAVRVTIPAQAIRADDKATLALGRDGGVFDSGFGPERIGPPVRLDHGQPLGAAVTVTWDLPADLFAEEAESLTLVRWNDELKVWSLSDQAFTVADGRLTAELREFSVWTWLNSAAAMVTQVGGEVTGTRAGALDCTVPHGDSPVDWVSGVVLPDRDQPAMPLRACLDPDRDERITLRTVSNRRFAQRLVVTRGEPFAWQWHGETDYSPAGILTQTAARVLSNDRGMVLTASHPQAVGIGRPATPGMHSFEFESRIDASTVAVDILAALAEKFGGDVKAFESPVANAMVQTLFDCGGERLLESRQVEAAALGKDALTVLKSCMDSDVVAEAIEKAKLAEIAKGGAAGRRAEQAFRWTSHVGAKLGPALRFWDASHYAAEFTSTLALGPTKGSMQLLGRPQALGAWTATCTDSTTDTDNLFRNIFWQEQFRDTSKEFHEFPGFPAAADAAIGPLAGCGKDHQEAVAGEVEATWADQAAGRIVAEAMRKRFDLSGCSLSLEAVRRLADDPNATMERQQCTTDKQWLLVTGVFKDTGSSPAGSLVLQRQQNTWRIIARMSHGGDCYDLLKAGAPIRELDRMPGAFPCGPLVAGELLEKQVITTGGIGDLRIGMSVQQALAAGYLQRIPPQGGCSIYVSSDSLADRQLVVAVDNGRVAGLLFKDPRWRTQSGARLGITRAELQRIYPRLTPGVDDPSNLPTLSVGSPERVTFVIWADGRVGGITVDNANRPVSWSGC